MPTLFLHKALKMLLLLPEKKTTKQEWGKTFLNFIALALRNSDKSISALYERNKKMKKNDGISKTEEGSLNLNQTAFNNPDHARSDFVIKTMIPVERLKTKMCLNNKI